MSQNTIAIGTRLYNHGDMANASHFSTVTEVNSDKWGTHIKVQTDDGATYQIEACMISPVYKGHGGTRIVTAEVYRAWREERIAKLESKLATAERLAFE